MMRLGLRHRPYFVIGVLVGLGVGIAMAQVAPPHLAVLVGWCCFVLAYVIPTYRTMQQSTPAQLRVRADLLDQGEGAVLAASLAAAIASLGAVGWSVMAHHSGVARIPVGLPIATIALSWVFVHMLFAVRYAHEYWQADGGLEFAGQARPVFTDFLYFAFTLGMTFQTSDTAVSTAPMRALTLVHALVSFVFNVVILAAAVNIAAGLVN
jgi:uncharacterized membrane protein